MEKILKSPSKEMVKVKKGYERDSLITEEIIKPTARKLISEINKFKFFLRERLNNPVTEIILKDYLPPTEESIFHEFIKTHNLNEIDYLILLLGLIISWKEDLFHDLIVDEKSELLEEIKKANKLGIQYDYDHQVFRPTINTIIKLVAEEVLEKEIVLLHYLENDTKLLDLGVIHLLAPKNKDNNHLLHHSFKMDNAYVSHFLTTENIQLEKTENFFADRLKSKLTLENIVFDRETWNRLKPLLDYLKVRKEMFENLPDFAQITKKGYVTLFHGYPGTGKTFTASIIGNHFDIPVYRVNLARVVSKYIGETEKNLENIFNRLQDEHCILFFDEADALFGKRSDVKEAKDRYANQEVAYLLQRIEHCNCFVVLATNFKHNLDYAFKRRIDSFIEIKFPGTEERLKLWQNYMPLESFTMDPPDLLERVAEKFAITGSQISNVCKQATIKSYVDHEQVINYNLLESFLKEEYSKEGRLFSQPNILPTQTIAKR